MKDSKRNDRKYYLIPEQFIKYFTLGHERSLRAKKNVLASLLFKGFNIRIGLLLVPAILHYPGQTRYGVWLALISVISWFGFMNLGLGKRIQAKANANANRENETRHKIKRG